MKGKYVEWKFLVKRILEKNSNFVGRNVSKSKERIEINEKLEQEVELNKLKKKLKREGLDEQESKDFCWLLGYISGYKWAQGDWVEYRKAKDKENFVKQRLEWIFRPGRSYLAPRAEDEKMLDMIEVISPKEAYSLYRRGFSFGYQRAFETR